MEHVGSTSCRPSFSGVIVPVPVLAARYVHKTYGRGPTRFDALRGVSLDIDEGDSVAIVGKSGSGKSTLMHLLALLDKPSEGTVELSGRNAADLGSGVLNSTRNDTFGFVFQQFFLTPNTSVLDNVTLPLRIAGRPAAERRRRGMDALEELELADKASSLANNLSGGQKQRVVIARALVNRPSVIFADEPTGNLDSATGGVVQDILIGLNQDRGITLVLVTHDDELAMRMSRQVYLRDGRVVDRDGVDIEQPLARSRRPLVSRTNSFHPSQDSERVA
jgi:putative ABC transport system ATP-binding protein